MGGIKCLKKSIPTFYPAYLHSLFPNIGRWTDPKSFILEALFMLLVALLAFASLTKRRRIEDKRADNSNRN